MMNPILNIEDKVQINDKTRFDASSSFVTNGSDALDTLEIKAGANGTFVEIYDSGDATPSDPEDWYLDWVWGDFTFDIDSTNNKIYFKLKSTGVEYVATLTDGTYTMAQLQAEIETQLDDALANGWSVDLSEKNEFTITGSAEVTLQAKKLPSNLLPSIGFPEEVTGDELEGNIVEAVTKQIVLRMTDSADTPNVTTKTFYQKVYSKEGDALFSTDADILFHEPDILKWVPRGRASFINAHRRSQELILQFLWQNNIKDSNGEKLTKFAVIDKEEVRLWSLYMTLHYLFMSFMTADDDVFKEKAEFYKEQMNEAKRTFNLSLDLNGDGEVDDEPKIDTGSCVLVRR